MTKGRSTNDFREKFLSVIETYKAITKKQNNTVAKKAK